MPANDFELRRRRALYRATHRGSKELDFVLGRFAQQSIESMSEDEIETLERLIDAPDPEIAASFYEGQTLGDAGLDAMIERLRRFHGYEITKSTDV
jgi:antitoxin CptB